MTLPDEGIIGVFGVRSSDSLEALPQDRVEVIARHAPDYIHFKALGVDVSTKPKSDYALAIVVLPRSKDEARHLIAVAAERTKGRVIVDGQKTDGVDSILKELARHAVVLDTFSKSHGKLAVAEDLSCTEWLTTGDALIEGRFHTAPGVFSADGVDPGSLLLANTLPQNLKGRVADLGAGWGYLSDAILTRPEVIGLDLVEADYDALEMARKNIADPRARFHWADARDFLPESPLDHVVMNPPFHTGRRPDASLGQAFIRQSAAMLKSKGSLWLVANRHLPYETVLQDAFAETKVLDETPSYKLFHATSPRRHRKG